MIDSAALLLAVPYIGIDGLSQTFEGDAESLYEAAALDIYFFRQRECEGDDA